MLLLLLVPCIWVLVTTLVVAVCRAAARGDARRPAHWHGAS